MSMTGHGFTDYRAIEDVERGKESGRAVALIVMRHRAATALFNREPLLRSIPGLNLAFLIHTQHQRFIRRIQVQAHPIVELFDKLFIFRQIESAGSMRLQSIGIPDTSDRRRVFTSDFVQRSRFTLGVSHFDDTDRICRPAFRQRGNHAGTVGKETPFTVATEDYVPR
jgi:hypothetical protein